VIKSLLSHGALLAPTNALHAAAAFVGGAPENQASRVEIIKFLIAQGCDVNKLEFAGEEAFVNHYRSRAYGTPLHYAAAWGWDSIVECLLRNGADMGVQARNYKKGIACGTPLEWAESNEPDEGMYNLRVLMLLGKGEEKL
jgi:ankyrin repeat protein